MELNLFYTSIISNFMVRVFQFMWNNIQNKRAWPWMHVPKLIYGFRVNALLLC